MQNVQNGLRKEDIAEKNEIPASIDKNFEKSV